MRSNLRCASGADRLLACCVVCVQNQVKPVISLLDQLRLKDESTNQIAFILDVFSSTLQRCTGNEHLHIDLKEALELALIDHTTRILIIGGTRTCPLQSQHRCSFRSPFRTRRGKVVFHQRLGRS